MCARVRMLGCVCVRVRKPSQTRLMKMTSHKKLAYKQDGSTKWDLVAAHVTVLTQRFHTSEHQTDEFYRTHIKDIPQDEHQIWAITETEITS